MGKTSCSPSVEDVERVFSFAYPTVKIGMVPLTPRLLRVLRDAAAKQLKAPTVLVAPLSKEDGLG